MEVRLGVQCVYPGRLQNQMFSSALTTARSCTDDGAIVQLLTDVRPHVIVVSHERDARRRHRR
jgi:hypothetical protein